MITWKFSLGVADAITPDGIRNCSWCDNPRAFILVSDMDDDEKLVTNQVDLCTSHAVTFQQTVEVLQQIAMIGE